MKWTLDSKYDDDVFNCDNYDDNLSRCPQSGPIKWSAAWYKNVW